ncbi:hypothetical protein B0T25DRAFT_595462 [Lasiosphaeria hispida]|uniref:HhH-GPD domain-containing protein n=1 Tax=Lasiosphaeria hispida TaxID=260671 RepID=A0AAJ0MJH6_9PEZI|nr:hypothetical protein B0T25DRAFT_595462 [Lasiosphaeria hispida]
MKSKNSVEEMTSLHQRSELMKLMLADQLMYGFDITDDETRDFLHSVITSGQVPRDDAEDLLRLSLMRGVEEWDMVIECAAALNNKALGPETNSGGKSSIVGVLDLLLTNGAGQILSPDGGGNAQARAEKQGEGGKGRKATSASSRKRLNRSVSHFWGNPQDDDEKSGGQHSKTELADLRPHDQPNNSQRVVVRGNEQDGVRVTRDPHQPPERAGDEDARLKSQSPWATRTYSPEIERELGSELSLEATKTASANPAIATTATQPQKRPDPAVKQKLTAKSPFFTTPSPRHNKQPTPTASPQRPAAAAAAAAAAATTPKNTRPPRGTISSLPIPPLSALSFGLIQETLAGDPFRLLIAVTFLIRTHGRAAIPVFHELMARFPTPEALAAAGPDEIVELIRPLGLAAVRCAAVQRYARGWVERPPHRERRYGVKNYPRHGDGREVRVGGGFGAEDGEGGEDVGDAVEDARRRAVGCAWEIGHLTQGPYALDSWRIFCRDVLLGRAEDWKGKGAPEGFQPEWMRVLPQDKELRACLRWMWMQEGWKWDPMSGEREPLPEELRRAVNERRVGYDDRGDLIISD